MNLKLLYLIGIILLLTSCGSSKSIVYLQDSDQLPENSTTQALKAQTVVVMPGDLISITVSGLNTDAVKPFNKIGIISELGGNSNSLSRNSSPYAYLVDNNGDIDFPIIGKLHIGGMNKDQISEFISNELNPKYLSFKPTVEVRFENFKVSVLGEVKTPGVYVSDNEKMNILEAIARAGDLTINGVRDNVMIIRDDANGKRIVHRVDLRDQNLIFSPYYNLQQNDIIYVQPNNSKARQSWQIPPALSLTLASMGTLISIATLIITIAK